MTEQQSSDRDRRPDEHPVETPESRMTGEGSPPPDEGQKSRKDGQEFATTDDGDDSPPAGPARLTPG